MNVSELVGSRVWIRRDRFCKISGVITNVLDPALHGTLQSTVAESLFDITLSSGESVQLLGAQIHKFEPRPKPVVLQTDSLILAAHPGD